MGFMSEIGQQGLLLTVTFVIIVLNLYFSCYVIWNLVKIYIARYRTMVLNMFIPMVHSMYLKRRLE
jgi:hypothetical protein